jgi:hypothetical protein
VPPKFVVTAAAVVAAETLFHPPWFEEPLSGP